MKIISLSDVPKKEVIADLFTGPVMRQSPVADSEGSQYSVDYVHFPNGVHAKFHSHSSDQVLISIEGSGIFVTENEETKLKAGDIVHSPAGEVHKHGAAPGSDFTHISITAAHTTLTQIEP